MQPQPGLGRRRFGSSQPPAWGRLSCNVDKDMFMVLTGPAGRWLCKRCAAACGWVHVQVWQRRLAGASTLVLEAASSPPVRGALSYNVDKFVMEVIIGHH